MVDIVEPAVRSGMMSGIRGKNSKLEMLIRRALFAAGYRFRLHRGDLPGSPDVVLPGRRVAIFGHGCFWHVHAGCKNARLPSTREEFWRTKLEANVARDGQNVKDLLAGGWRVLTVWECATRNPAALAGLSDSLSKWIESSELKGEISAAQSA